MADLQDKYIVFAILGQSNAMGAGKGTGTQVDNAGRVMIYSNMGRLIGFSGDWADQDYAVNSANVDYDGYSENNCTFVPALVNQRLRLFMSFGHKVKLTRLIPYQRQTTRQLLRQ
jgi:hypothetical protein